MSNFPVGPKTLEKAAKTEAGKLAAALNRVMYQADNADIGMRSHKDAKNEWQYTIHAHKYVCPDKVFRNQDQLPKGVPGCGIEEKYFETEKLMISIRDYLEAEAIRAVCD